MSTTIFRKEIRGFFSLFARNASQYTLKAIEYQNFRYFSAKTLHDDEMICTAAAVVKMHGWCIDA